MIELRCEEAQELLLLHAGGDLPDDQLVDLEAHLEECSDCYSDLEEACAMRGRMAATFDAQGPEFDSREFAQSVLHDIETGAKKRAVWPPRRRLWWLAAAAVLALLAVGILRSREYGSQDPTAITSGDARVEFTWAELSGELLNCFDRPVPLSDWELPSQPGVVAILQRPDPELRPEVFVLAYCTEGRDLARAPRYPWFEQRVRRLTESAGPIENLYVAACPLPDSDRHQRRAIASELIREYRPALNQAGGV